MVRSKVWVAKDSPRTTAGELQKIVESWGQKTLKKCQTAPTSPHVVWEGLEKKYSLIQKQTPAYSVIRHDWNFKWDWLYGQVKLKTIRFLAANTQDGFGEHINKKYPMCCISDVVGLYFCWRSCSSCLDTWHHGFYQIPTDKKSISDWLC